MLHNALRLIVKPPNSACAESRNVPQCCRMCRNGFAWRSYLDTVAGQQQGANRCRIKAGRNAKRMIRISNRSHAS